MLEAVLVILIVGPLVCWILGAALETVGEAAEDMAGVVTPPIVRFRNYLSPTDPAKGWYYMICIGAALLILGCIIG